MLNRSRTSFLTVLALAAVALPLALAQAPGATEKELADLENRWAEAIVKGDVATLERLYADEYMAIDPTGATFTKDQDIANVKSGNFKLASFKIDELKVRVHGDVAVVTSRNTIKGTYMGKDASGAYRGTDVFVKRGGRWQVLTTQATAVTTQ